MTLIQQLAPVIYLIPSHRSVMYAVRDGVGIGEHFAADRDHREVVEDDRWSRLGDLFEQGLSGITEASRNRRYRGGMIYPKGNWQSGDREWLREQAKKMGVRITIGPLAEQAGWHTDTPWVSFDWVDLYFKALDERLKMGK